MVAISRNTLQQVARDNFGILQALKTCLFGIVGFSQLVDEFTSSDDRLTFYNCGRTRFLCFS